MEDPDFPKTFLFIVLTFSIKKLKKDWSGRLCNLKEGGGGGRFHHHVTVCRFTPYEMD